MQRKLRSHKKKKSWSSFEQKSADEGHIVVRHRHMSTHACVHIYTLSWPLRCVLSSQGNKGKETRDINPQQQVLNNVEEKPHSRTYTYLPTPVFLGGVQGAWSWHKARCACQNQSEHSAEGWHLQLICQDLQAHGVRPVISFHLWWWITYDTAGHTGRDMATGALWDKTGRDTGRTGGGEKERRWGECAQRSFPPRVLHYTEDGNPNWPRLNIRIHTEV